MRKKDFLLSIILNGFLGYLWVLFAENMYQLSDSSSNVFLGGMITFGGTVLFWAIASRINPFKEYKKTHPLNIVGFISSLIVVLICACSGMMNM